MRLQWIATAFSIFLLTNASAQKLMGVVVEKDTKGQDQPLPGANVYWLGTTKGATTRDNGVFIIDRIPWSSRAARFAADGKSGRPVSRSSSSVFPIFVTWATASTRRPSCSTVTRLGGAGRSRSQMSCRIS